MADEKAPGNSERPEKLSETESDPQLTVEKIELNAELEEVVGGVDGYQKDYDNCFGVHLTSPKPKNPLGT